MQSNYAQEEEEVFDDSMDFGVGAAAHPHHANADGLYDDADNGTSPFSLHLATTTASGCDREEEEDEEEEKKTMKRKRDALEGLQRARTACTRSRFMHAVLSKVKLTQEQRREVAGEGTRERDRRPGAARNDLGTRSSLTHLFLRIVHAEQYAQQQHFAEAAAAQAQVLEALAAVPEPVKKVRRHFFLYLPTKHPQLIHFSVILLVRHTLARFAQV